MFLKRSTLEAVYFFSFFMADTRSFCCRPMTTSHKTFWLLSQQLLFKTSEDWWPYSFTSVSGSLAVCNPAGVIRITRVSCCSILTNPSS